MRKRSFKRVWFCLIGFFLVAVIFFFLGTIMHRLVKAERLDALVSRYILQHPPTKQKPLADGVFDTVEQTQFRNLITIHSHDDIQAKRKALKRFIWRNAELPFGKLPDRVESVTMLSFADIDSVAGVERLDILMPLGVTSVAYDFKPKQPRSCLMVYQEGHRVSFLERKSLIRHLLDAGCEVVALSYPLTGSDNTRPTIDHPRFGRIFLNNPDDFQFLETESFSTIQFFLSPPIIALNHALAGRQFQRVGIAGFSGGGWAAELIGALDPRFDSTYSVAGSSPFAVHAAAEGWGSFEQNLARLYDIATYTELYVMAAAGTGRRNIQFFNEFDPCCFSGDNYQFWRDPVAERASELGGSFDIIIDRKETKHTLGKMVRDFIVHDFSGQ